MVRYLNILKRGQIFSGQMLLGQMSQRQLSTNPQVTVSNKRDMAFYLLVDHRDPPKTTTINSENLSSIQDWIWLVWLASWGWAGV